MVAKTIKDKHLEDLKRIQKLRLLDDDFMTKVFEDKECVQLLLQIILERDDLIVQYVDCQYDVKNLQGRSVRLDILATDRFGKLYNIEIQRSDKGAGMKRARYNSSLLDANITEPGEDCKNLKETFVIFITENDVLKSNLPIYHIDRVIRETGEKFEDESHIIYVNSKIQDETALGQLMHDFACTEADSMHYDTLAKRVRYFKEDEEGVANMCKELEKMRNEAAKEAAKKEKTKVLLELVQDGLLSIADAAKRLDLTIDQVKKML